MLPLAVSHSAVCVAVLMLQLLEGCSGEMGISRTQNLSDVDLDLCEHPALCV